MDGVTLTPLKQMVDNKGSVMHALKRSDFGYCGFGEAYFSSVNQNAIKGWKKHLDMTLNLIVVCGEVRFVVYDGSCFFSETLSKDNYRRLTIEPGKWVAFQGLEEQNILLNIASIEHNPLESENVGLESIEYDW